MQLWGICFPSCKASSEEEKKSEQSSEAEVDDTTEILDLMEKRRMAKQDACDYRKLEQKLKSEPSNYWEKLENLEKKDIQLMHKRVKDLIGNKSTLNAKRQRWNHIYGKRRSDELMDRRLNSQSCMRMIEKNDLWRETRKNQRYQKQKYTQQWRKWEKDKQLGMTRLQ